MGKEVGIEVGGRYLGLFGLGVEERRDQSVGVCLVL